MTNSPQQRTRRRRTPPDPRRLLCLLGCAGAAALPLACTAPGPAPAAAATPPHSENPFLGTWATVDDNPITFRPETVVAAASDGSPVAFADATCRGVFRFGYTSKSREALAALVPRQPTLRRRLAALLPAPSYPVAVLDCDQGDQTFVMLAPGQLLAIYRDGDIGAIERLARR